MYNYTGSSWFVDKGAGGSFQSMGGYATDTMASFASDFIGRNAPRSQPFFLYLSIVAPHAGIPSDPDDISGFASPYVKPVYRDRFEGRANTDPSFNEADVSDKPIQNPRLSSAEIVGLTESNAQRRESELSVDDAVTRIMDALSSSGELDNTYVMFMSDNGLVLGEHRLRGGKLVPYEVANHVPFMVRGPGISSGTVVPDVTAQVDFAPTVLDMAGLAAPSSVDGISLLPTMKDPTRGLTRPGVVIEATDTKVRCGPAAALALPRRGEGALEIRRAHLGRQGALRPHRRPLRADQRRRQGGLRPNPARAGPAGWPDPSGAGGAQVQVERR